MTTLASIHRDFVAPLGLRGTGCCPQYNTTLSRHSACGVQDAALNTTRLCRPTRPAGYRMLPSIQHDIVTSLGLRGTGCCPQYNTTLSRHSACGVQDAALNTTRHCRATRPAGYRMLPSIQHDIVTSLGLRGTGCCPQYNTTLSRHSACGVQDAAIDTARLCRPTRSAL
jgi:hypothetical protein